ncbi:MAG: hypothetical protein H6550_16170 [Chitinophagales bacterium]|nr:hypothetical protein [Chitinophagales bacterium]
MTQDERNALISEQEQLTIKMKNAAFISPKDMRRSNEITSLLLTDGTDDSIRIKVGKPKKSRRVTSFTRDRR